MIQAAVDELATADKSLAKASIMMGVSLYDEAGRQAYLTMFHAAHALVAERGFTPPKRHGGLLQLFTRIARTEPSNIQQLVRPLAISYQFKWIADYDTSGSTVSAAEAQSAIRDATQFVSAIRTLLLPPFGPTPPQSPPPTPAPPGSTP